VYRHIFETFLFFTASFKEKVKVTLESYFWPSLQLVTCKVEPFKFVTTKPYLWGAYCLISISMYSFLSSLCSNLFFLQKPPSHLYRSYKTAIEYLNFLSLLTFLVVQPNIKANNSFFCFFKMHTVHTRQAQNYRCVKTYSPRMLTSKSNGQSYNIVLTVN
jgi:hypothetical protein